MVRLDRIRQQVHYDTCLHSGDLDRSSLKKNRILDQAVALFAQKVGPVDVHVTAPPARRSEEHTSELQSLMRISYAVFCLKKKNKEETDLSQSIKMKIINTEIRSQTHKHT